MSLRKMIFHLKKVGPEDLGSAHGVPPKMMGIIPNNAKGFRDIIKPVQVFSE